MPKVQGPGGLGQWDTGTANRDIRASIPSSGGGGGGYQGNVVTPQDIAQGQAIIARNARKQGRGRRKMTRGGRKGR